MPSSANPLEDWEYPEPDELDDDDSVDTRECPACGTKIYEEAEQCPACGEYIVFSNSALPGWPWWIVVVALIVALLAMMWS